LSTLLAKIIAGGRAIGPYGAIELLMPGGSLIALLLWIYRVHHSATDLSACETPCAESAGAPSAPKMAGLARGLPLRVLWFVK
jgi:hypothetical protein